MTPEEKYLYHQTQPAKLVTDVAAGLASLYPFWQHQFVVALIVLIVPPVLASFLIMRFADLGTRRRSKFGRYVRTFMTRAVEAVRLLGMLVMACGAWYRSPAVIAAGALVIVLAWMRGLLPPRSGGNGAR